MATKTIKIGATFLRESSDWPDWSADLQQFAHANRAWKDIDLDKTYQLAGDPEAPEAPLSLSELVNNLTIERFQR